MDQVYRITSVTGAVFVVGVAGRVRVAKVGDRVLRGETLLTGARGHIELVASDDTALALGPQARLALDEQLFSSSRPVPAQASLASGTIERVIDALAGNADLTETLEAPAAGTGAAAGGCRTMRAT